MFTGIVETTAKIIAAKAMQSTTEIKIERPTFFDDLARGQSISVNGVCLTIENFDHNEMSFTLGPETIKIMTPQFWRQGCEVNLERSLKFNDRIHGSLVTGHVDSVAKVVELQRLEAALIVIFIVPTQFNSFIWNKGTICVNGVSLTINNVLFKESGTEIEVCLIPETLKRTNLKNIKVNDSLTIEYDYVTKVFLNSNKQNAKGVTHEFHT